MIFCDSVCILCVMRKEWLLLLPALLVMGFCLDSGTTVNADHENGGLHWKSLDRDKVRIVDHTCRADVVAGLRHAIQAWNSVGASGLNVVFHQESCGGISRVSGTDIGVYLNRCRTSTLACAVVTQDGQHITGAYINFPGAARSKNARDRSVMTHELGHALGLHHTRDRGSPLCEVSCTDRPSKHDQEALRGNYNHLDRVAADKARREQEGPVGPTPPVPTTRDQGFCLIPNNLCVG